MKSAAERFLEYISVDTTSREEEASYPSSEGQWELARMLEAEMKKMGLEEVELDEHGYVTATIPANVEGVPVLGLISHMDTSSAVAGGPVHPKLVDYRGGDILLNRELDLWLREEESPELAGYKGKTLIVTDGTTLLGADDKAGIAEILTAAERLTRDPSIRHGKIRICLTPDEEISRGTLYFDVKKFGADAAYTVDGGALGEVEYENFNGASANITIRGRSIHPGEAKGRMLNSLMVAWELQGMLPAHEQPAYTEGYEGFYHLSSLSGSTAECSLKYIIRQHDRKEYEAKKARMEKIVSYLNEKYGPGTVELSIRDMYFNMYEIIKNHMHLIDKANAAFMACGIKPRSIPVRGGTDGARLSYMGLPCPNLSTGGHNFHGVYEYIPVESMQSMTDVLVALAEEFAASAQRGEERECLKQFHAI